MVADISCRQAVLADIPLLAGHHRMMFEEMRSGGDDDGVKDSCCSPSEQLANFPTAVTVQSAAPPLDFDRLETAQTKKLTEQMTDGSCMAWIADYAGKSVASGAVTVIKTVPVPEDPGLETAFLHSVYTIPSMRGRGIASAILDRLITSCRNRGLKRVQLNASEMGREVYRKKGFQPLERVMLLWL
jgi:GNAT superfamily N-acetyltransferase